MSNMITEHYVSFEVAKLLRDRGFQEKCIAYYPHINEESKVTFGGRVNYNGPNKFKMVPPASAPTLQMTREWLFEIYHLFIEVNIDRSPDFKGVVFRVSIYRCNQSLEWLHDLDGFTKPELAEEAGIKYCLENLVESVSNQVLRAESIEIYTDGGCRDNPGPGAYAYAVIYNDEIIHQDTEFKSKTTNNEMELSAILAGLKVSPKYCTHDGTITVVSDSQYALKSIFEWSDKWVRDGTIKFRPNGDLISDIKKVIKDLKLSGRMINYKWVRGHDGNKFNEHVDQLLNTTMDAFIK